MSHKGAPNGRFVLVTGCSTGIGYAAAKALDAEGWRVIATARKPADVEKLQAEGLDALALDYASEDSIVEASEAVKAKTEGRLYGLFNNGAYGLPGAVEDIPTAALRAQFEANFFGWHELTRQLLPGMIEAGEGRIVQCSSVLGFVALKYRGAYVASKFALEGLTDTLRLELEGTGVQISLIEPGPIRTQFNINAAEAFKRDVDYSDSRHKAFYLERLEDPDYVKQDNKYTLEPEACLPPLRHALTAKRAKARYYVTRPTYYLSYLKRFLPTSIIDRLLIANSRA